MPEIIPVSNHGNREIMVTLDGADYRFRTYYSMGQHNGWFLDIKTGSGEPIVVGKRIVTGSANLLKGCGKPFRDRQLTVVTLSGHESGKDALGVGTYLLWFGEGEVNPYAVGDPMIDIPADEWTFRSTSGYYFGVRDNGDIYVRNRIKSQIVDSIAGKDGDVYIKDNIPSDSQNDFLLERDGDVLVRDNPINGEQE